MQHQITRTAFGEVLGHPTKPYLRFFTDTGAGGAGGAGGDGAGAAAGAAGAAAGAAGGTGAAGAAAGAGEGDQPLSAEDAKAVRATADKAMRERNAARDAAKAYTDLGLTPEEITALKAERDAKNGGPTPEQIQKDADKRADAAAAAKFAGVARVSAVRAQAAELGFHNPASALALLDPKALDDVTVDPDTYQADSKAVETLLKALAAAEPYLVKAAGQQTVDYRTAGIGGTGGGARHEPATPTERMKNAYAATSPAR